MILNKTHWSFWHTNAFILGINSPISVKVAQLISFLYFFIAIPTWKTSPHGIVKIFEGAVVAKCEYCWKKKKDNYKLMRNKTEIIFTLFHCTYLKLLCKHACHMNAIKSTWNYKQRGFFWNEKCAKMHIFLLPITKVSIRMYLCVFFQVTKHSENAVFLRNSPIHKKVFQRVLAAQTAWKAHTFDAKFTILSINTSLQR